MGPTQSFGLLDLPIECRHSIYQYLFCHSSSPVWLSSKYSGWDCFQSPEPVFHTQLFRVCKSISNDAIIFAYSANKFILRDSNPAFRRLGKLALASLKDLTVIHNAWTAEHREENTALEIMKASCTGLKCLELDLHADMLLEAVSYLTYLWRLSQPGVHRPNLVLDFYVWERHFAFDSTARDFSRSIDLLQGTHKKSTRTPNFVHPLTRIHRLPTSPDDIILSADVGQGLIQAMDLFLSRNTSLPLVKQQQILPISGRRSCGRSARFCYTWEEPTCN